MNSGSSSSPPPPSMLFIFKVLALLLAASSAAEATWCVVRSDASEQAMQRALDYACGGGADCAPIQSTGLCYLPNTLQAHASYAINSYYQRRGNAPGSCSFGGAAATATTDPSYGSCVYPSSPRNAGGNVATPTTSNTTPATNTLPFGVGVDPRNGTTTVNVPYSPTSNSSYTLPKPNIFITWLIFMLIFKYHLPTFPSLYFLC